MNEYAKSAADDFVQAVRGEDVLMVARRLNSRVFKEQARGFISNRWEGKAAVDILADLERAENYKYALKWDTLHSIGYTGDLDLIPLEIFKQIPTEPFHRYQYKYDSSSSVDGYETFLSTLLRKRSVPKEYKDYLKTLDNLPSYSKQEPLPRKVIEDVHPTAGSLNSLYLSDPFLPDCKDAPWYEEYMYQIEGRRYFNAPRQP